MEINTIEVSGFASALKSLRLPFGKEPNSVINTALHSTTTTLAYGTAISLDEKDTALLSTLIERGDEHAKPARGILAYADITAPIDFWGELETYKTGHERLFSGSTMNDEGKKLRGHALREALDKISFGREIHKIDFFSYQTLRRIVSQRFNHRKYEWHVMIEWIKTLPYADELILKGLEHKLTIHDQYLSDYNNGII